MQDGRPDHRRRDERRHRCGRDVDDRDTDLVPNPPRVVARRHPRVVGEVDAVTVDVQPALRGSDVVVARDVGVDAPAVARAVHLVVLEHRGNGAVEDPLERNRLYVVRVEREPDAPHRLEHLVAHRPDRGRVAVATELTARADRPLLGAPRHTRVHVHHAPVRILAEPETERDGSVAARQPSRRSSPSRSDPTARRWRTCRRSGARAARRAAPAARAPSRCRRDRELCVTDLIFTVTAMTVKVT